jgi:SAM-dependent methyltransferase
VNTGGSTDDIEVYGEGFSAVYTTSRYTLFSQRLAKLALAVIRELGAPGNRLLDLACGAGAGSVVLAEAGFEVMGVDRSSVMLRYAEDLAQARGISLELHYGDMRSFSVDQQVDIVTCLFDALNYLLSEDDLAESFRRVAAALRPGGLFVFDMNTIHGLTTRWGTKDVVSTSRPSLFEVNQNRFDPETNVNTTTTTVFVRAENSDLFHRYTEVHRERGYAPSVVLELLERAGLTCVSVRGLADMYSGLTGGLEDLTETSGRMVIAARKS